MSKWIDIAKEGIFTDMKGREVVFTPDLIDKIISASDDKVKKKKIPLAFGHPKLTSPSFGWLAGLQKVRKADPEDGVEKDFLQAYFEDVLPEVNAVISAKHYKHGSLAFDPVTGVMNEWSLLGVAAPAIPLPEVTALAGDDTAVRVCCFADAKTFSQIVSAQDMWRVYDSLRESVESIMADNNISDKQSSVSATIDQFRGFVFQKLFQETDMTEIEKLKEELSKATERIKESEGKLAEALSAKASAESSFAAYQADQAKKAREARFAAAVKDERATPGERDAFLAKIEVLEASDKKLMFAASDGSQQEMSLAENEWRKLENRQKNGLLSEFASPDQAYQPGNRQTEVMDTKRI